MNTTITINNTLQADVERDRLLDRMLDELEPAGPMINSAGGLIVRGSGSLIKGASRRPRRFRLPSAGTVMKVGLGAGAGAGAATGASMLKDKKKKKKKRSF